MEDRKRNQQVANTQNLNSKISNNPLDQFSDVVFGTVDNMVEDNQEESKNED